MHSYSYSRPGFPVPGREDPVQLYAYRMAFMTIRNKSNSFDLFPNCPKGRSIWGKKYIHTGNHMWIPQGSGPSSMYVYNLYVDTWTNPVRMSDILMLCHVMSRTLVLVFWLVCCSRGLGRVFCTTSLVPSRFCLLFHYLEENHPMIKKNSNTSNDVHHRIVLMIIFHQILLRVLVRIQYLSTELNNH